MKKCGIESCTPTSSPGGLVLLNSCDNTYAKVKKGAVKFHQIAPLVVPRLDGGSFGALLRINLVSPHSLNQYMYQESLTTHASYQTNTMWAINGMRHLLDQ